MNRRVLLVVVLGVIAAGVWARLSSDERAVERVVEELVAGGRVSRGEPRAVRNERLERLLSETTSARLSIQSVDLPPAPPGRAALLGWAEQLEAVDDAAVELVDPRTMVEGRRATVHSDVTFKAHAGGSEWTDRRAVVFRLGKGEHGWRVSGIDVGARPNDRPEARP